MRQIFSAAVLGSCLFGLAPAGGAAELTTLNSKTAPRVTINTVDLSRYRSEPTKTPTKTPSYGVELVEDDPLSVAEPLHSFAFDHFQADDNGDSLINGYLCAYLSEAIYSNQLGYSETWEDVWRYELMEEGAIDVEFDHDAVYGAEVAAVWLDHAVIIVCRGSHFNGSEAFPLTDWIVDADDDAVRRDFGGFQCRVHEGVWNATNSVYDWILTTALAAVAEGKQVWITGHSLGGATATIAAARLHYDEGIAVQGVHTFGSFKVGDRDFEKLMTMPGADEFALHDYIQRWAVNGDYATTLFYRDFVPYKTRWGGFYVYYEHVGRTHQITRTGDFSGPDWDVDFDTIENTNMFALPDSVLPLGEHGDYYPALRNEIELQMSNAAEEDVLEDLLRLTP